VAAYYVKATGSNTAPYDTWAKASTTLATILALPPAANDVVYVFNTHSEVLATTNASGITLYSTSDSTNQPPTTFAVGATLTAVAASGAAAK
jgi:hypothetical protein